MSQAKIGFMQGRLSPIIDGKIQCFPRDYWQDEFAQAEKLTLPIMEWTLDHENLAENPLVSSAGQNTIRDLCATHNVQIVSVTGDCFMQAPFYKATGKIAAQLIDELKLIIDSCNALSIPNLLIPLVDDGRLEDQQQRDQLLEVLASFDSHLIASHLNITFETDMAPNEYKDFINLLNPKCFGITYDIGNSASLGFNPEEEFKAYGERIIHVHVKDRKRHGTTVPLGHGDADFPAVFSLLKQQHYNGAYILQTARADDGNHARALSLYRDMVAKWIMD